MKNIIALLLCFILTVSLISCNTVNDEPKIPSDDRSDDTSNEEKYKPVLDIYKDVVMNFDEQGNSKDSPYSEGTKEYEWRGAIIVAVTTLRLSTNVLGYAFCDLNKNGNDEMFLLLDDYTVLAIFSFADGKPILLDKYWNRKKCAIEADGTIQVYGSGGADTFSFSIYEIAKDDTELVRLEEYGMDGCNPETLHPYYYKISNGNKTPITVLEYAAAFSLYHYTSLTEHTKENASFAFVPLELDYKSVFEKLLTMDNVPEREVVTLLMVSDYSKMGEFSKAKELAKSQSPVFASRECLLVHASEESEREKYLGEAVFTLLDELKKNIETAATTKKSLVKSGESQKILLSLVKFFEDIFEDGRFGKFHSNMRDLYLQISMLEAGTGEINKAVEYFDNAYNHHIKLLELENVKEYRFFNIFRFNG